MVYPNNACQCLLKTFFQQLSNSLPFKQLAHPQQKSALSHMSFQELRYPCSPSLLATVSAPLQYLEARYKPIGEETYLHHKRKRLPILPTAQRTIRGTFPIIRSFDPPINADSAIGY